MSEVRIIARGNTSHISIIIPTTASIFLIILITIGIIILIIGADITTIIVLSKSLSSSSTTTTTTTTNILLLLVIIINNNNKNSSSNSRSSQGHKDRRNKDHLGKLVLRPGRCDNLGFREGFLGALDKHSVVCRAGHDPLDLTHLGNALLHLDQSQCCLVTWAVVAVAGQHRSHEATEGGSE